MAGYLIGGRLVAGGGLDAGEITVRAIPASSMTFELPLNSDGSIDVDVSLPMVDPFTGSSVDLANLLIPGRDFIGWVENDVILEAGPIWGDPFTFPTKGRIVARGLLSYFEHRYVLPVLTPGQLPRHVSSRWVGLSPRTVIKRLVEQCLSHPHSGLPIDFESDVLDLSAPTVEIPGSDLKTVAEAMVEQSELEGGPDFTLRPKWGSDRRHVRWTLLTGNPELTQTGDDHYWDVSVPDPHATVNSLDRDGSELTSREFQTGATLTNMIFNGSFEQGIDGWEDGPNGQGATYHVSNPRSGLQAGAWSSSGAGLSYLHSTRTENTEPDDVYTMSAYVRASAVVGMGVMIRWKDANRVDIGDVHSAPEPSATGSGWSRVRATVRAPAAARFFETFIYGDATAGGMTFHVDDVMLTRGPELLEYAVDEVKLQARADDSSLTSAGFPLLESVTDRSSVALESVLQAYGNEAVVRGSAHIETFNITARRDKYPLLGTYWPGDYARIRIGKNPRIPADTYRVRIVRVDFGIAGDVTVECAPERVASGYPVPSSDRTWLRNKLRGLSRAVAEKTRGT